MSVAEISKGKAAEVGGRPRPSLAPLRGFAAMPGRGFLLTAGSIAIAFLSWQVLSTFIFNPFLIPPPLEVIRTAIPMILSGEILADVSISMSRVLVGFVVGSLAAIVFGVLLGRLQLLHDLLDPIIELMRYLSPTAMIPIAVIWFGIGELSKYFLCLLGHVLHCPRQYHRGGLARADRAPACGRMPRRKPDADLRPGRHPVGGPVHRDRHAGGDGLLVHEHHSGGDSRRRLRHRLSVAEILDAVADESHLRRAAHDLLARIPVRPRLPLSCRAHARALHVVRRRDVRGD
jgi:hypothetical protein